MADQWGPFRPHLYVGRPMAPGVWITFIRLAGRRVGIHCKLGSIAVGVYARRWVITNEEAA